MDLHCPHCTRRVTVPDDKAGLVMSCPLCGKQFMAPSLPPPAPPPPAAPVPTYGLGPPPAPPPPVPTVPVRQPEPAAPPPPPLPPGEYTRTVTWHLQGKWLAYVPTASLGLIFFFSFFNWHQYSDRLLSMWGLAVEVEPLFLFYTLLFFLCFPLAIASLVVELKLFVPPPNLEPFLRFKDLIVALFLAIGFLLLCVDYFLAYFSSPTNPILLGEKVVVRLHLLAIVASLLMFWLHWRRMTNLPFPKCELRW